MNQVQELETSAAEIDAETEAEAPLWRDVCAIDDVPRGTGVAALVDGEQIAIVRTCDDQLAALSNFDPFSNAFVIARGIVGDRGGVPKIASPVYKQSFALDDGRCLDDPTIRLPVFPVRLVGSRVLVLIE